MASSNILDNGSLEQTTLETSRLILRPAQSSDAIHLHEGFKDPEVMRYWSSAPHPDLAKTETWTQCMMNSTQNGVTDFVITLKQQPASLSSPNDTTADVPSSVSETLSSDPSTDNSTVPVGKIGVYSPVPANEIGFQISRAYWGNGLAKEALTCILTYLFNLPRLDAPEKDEQQLQNVDTTKSKPNSHESVSYRSVYLSLSPEETNESIPWRYLSITADVDPRNAASLGLLMGVGFVKTGFVEKTDCVDGQWVDSVYLKLQREKWMERIDRKI